MKRNAKKNIRKKGPLDRKQKELRGKMRNKNSHKTTDIMEF